MNSFDMLIKRQIKLTILTVIAVVLMSVTISYALYQTNHENTTNQVISIGSLGLTATGTPITLNGLYPMEEYDLTDSYPRYEFTLENKTDNTYNDYTLMYELVLTPTSQDFTTSDYQYIIYKIDGMEAQPLSEAWDDDINGYKILNGRLLSHSETLDYAHLKDTENHSIVFWLSTTAPDSMNGKSVSLSMTLSAYADRFNYLKQQNYTGSITSNNLTSDNILGNKIDRTLFESITFLDTIDIPNNIIESWDVSQKQNGEIMAWYTDNDANDLYELYIGQIGGVILNPNSSCLFVGFTNVTHIYGTNNLITKYVTNMMDMFSCMPNLVDLSINNFDVSNITNMYRMFSYCSSLESIDLSNWYTPNIIAYSISGIFHNCNKIKNINIKNFDLSQVTDITSMFNGCTSLSELNMQNVVFRKNVSSNFIFHVINPTVKIITNECAESLIRARLADANRPNATVIATPCVKICYSNNYNILPSAYTELEYIASTGTQYIDSGYKPTPNTGVYADFQYTSTTGTQRLFGVDSYTNVDNTISYSFYIENNKYDYTYQNNSGNWINTNITADIKRHTVSFNKNNDKKLYINTYSGNLSGNPTNASTQNMYIMANNRINTNIIDSYSKVRIYSFQIYESGILVRNYVPAMRNSDNVLGLYETLNSVFYENSGTGTFNTNASKTLIGDTMQIIEKVDARAGYTFIGWNTKPDGTGTMFNQGEKVDASVLKSIGDEITLYAIWEAN